MLIALVCIIFSIPAFAMDMAAENYLIAEDNVKLPNGMNLGQFTVAFIHWLPKPDKNTIDEEVVVFLNDRKTGRTCKQTRRMKFNITDGSVEILEDGVTVGKGKLVGENWKWTSLEFEVLVAGKKVLGFDQFSAKAWTSEKTVFSLDGTPEISIESKLRAITRGTFEIMKRADVKTCEM